MITVLGWIVGGIVGILVSVPPAGSRAEAYMNGFITSGAICIVCRTIATGQPGPLWFWTPIAVLGLWLGVGHFRASTR